MSVRNRNITIRLLFHCTFAGVVKTKLVAPGLDFHWGSCRYPVSMSTKHIRSWIATLSREQAVKFARAISRSFRDQGMISMACSASTEAVVNYDLLEPSGRVEGILSHGNPALVAEREPYVRTYGVVTIGVNLRPDFGHLMPKQSNMLLSCHPALLAEGPSPFASLTETIRTTYCPLLFFSRRDLTGRI